MTEEIPIVLTHDAEDHGTSATLGTNTKLPVELMWLEIPAQKKRVDLTRVTLVGVTVKPGVRRNHWQAISETNP